MSDGCLVCDGCGVVYLNNYSSEGDPCPLNRYVRASWPSPLDLCGGHMVPIGLPLTAPGGPAPSEGRMPLWADCEDVPPEIIQAFQRECANIDPDSEPSYWTVAQALVAASKVGFGPAGEPPE